MSDTIDKLRISDSLRVIAHHDYDYDCATSKRLYDFADRIDAETVELPRDKDGKPIRVGETVYGKDGKAWCVRGVTIGEMSEALRYTISVTSDTGEWRHIRHEWFTHECPDSLERIVSDMSAEIESMESSITASDDALDALRDYMERIKVLAEVEGGSDD